MADNFDTLNFYVPQELFIPSTNQEIDGIFSPKLLKSQFDSYDLKSDVKYHIDITNTGDAFLLKGKAYVEALTQCSRCLSDVEVNLNGKIDSFYLIEEPSEKDEEQINEFEVLPADHNLPIGFIIKQSLLIDAPLQPLCKDDCKGLCPICGQNLNVSQCCCKSEPDPSSPFAALKDLHL